MRHALVIGAGPAGLFAAERLAQAGWRVTVADANPRPGRKFLVAGRSGLNLTHSEALPEFISRYGTQAERFARYLSAFPPTSLRAWADGLAAATFIGSSGRVFPQVMTGAPLLAAWRARLDDLGVVWRHRARLTALERGPLAVFGSERLAADAIVLALGGASWPDTGSDGAWPELLRAHGVAITPFAPANCGFTVAWPDAVRAHAGQPLKTLAVALDASGPWKRGECVIAESGLEGGAIYAVAAGLRDRLLARGTATLWLDLKPDLSADAVAQRPLAGLRLTPAAQSVLAAYAASDPALVKRIPVPVLAPRPLAEAISTAGGVAFSALDEGLQLVALPGVHVCGEMLDWEAPTGGYLLQGCFSTAAWVAAHLG